MRGTLVPCINISSKYNYKRMLHSFVIFLSVLGFGLANINGKQLYALDLDKLHELQKNNMREDSFIHTTVFFDAIHSGKRTLEIKSIKDTIDTDATKSYETLSKQALHKTTTTIDLLPKKQYFSLDIPRVLKNIHSIGTDYIVHCNSNDVRVGDYYIGTSDSEHADVKTHSNNGIQQGFIFSREVVHIDETNIINGSSDCRRMETKVVHPLQIMNTRVETKISFPYSRVILPENENQGVRKLPERDAFIQPDSPLLLCDDEDVTSRLGSVHKADSKSFTLRGIPVDFGYALDVKGTECVDITATVPGSINYNHGSRLNAIKKNIALSGGVTCTNCYAFVGAGVLAVFNIFGGNMATFAFEAKDEGGMGYNLDILISNPSFSASKYIKLAGDGPVSSIPIAYGLALDINFGGAWATIKGSGSAKGQASFSSGYTLNEEDYIMYAKSRWTSEHSLISSNRITPTYTNKGLSLTTTSLTGIVSLSTRIHFSLGGSIPVIDVGASVEFSTVLTATAQFIRSGKKYSLALSFDDTSRRILASKNGYSPEDTISFNVDYSGLNENEDHELYFNIHKYMGFNASLGTGYPIKLHKFKSSKSGSGSLKVEWKVPHDSKFMQKYRDAPHIHFSVHSSARLERAHTSKNAKLVHKRNTKRNAVFKSPKNGDSVFIGEPITIEWEPNSLKYFDYYKGTDGLGVEKVPEAVNIIIVSVESKTAYQLENDIKNTGKYTTKIPESLLKRGKRFFLVIHDAKEYSRMAWHNGDFELKKRPDGLFRFRRVPDKRISTSNSSEELPPANVEPPTIEFDIPLWNNTLLFETIGPSNIGHIQRILVGPSACSPQQAALSVLLQMEFGFDGFNIMGRHFSMGSTSSSPFIIIPQTNFCV